jgi:hypothetical protein
MRQLLFPSVGRMVIVAGVFVIGSRSANRGKLHVQETQWSTLVIHYLPERVEHVLSVSQARCIVSRSWGLMLC